MMSGMFPMSLSSLVSSNPKITITFVLAGAGAVACYLEYLRRDRNERHKSSAASSAEVENKIKSGNIKLEEAIQYYEAALVEMQRENSDYSQRMFVRSMLLRAYEIQAITSPEEFRIRSGINIAIDGADSSSLHRIVQQQCLEFGNIEEIKKLELPDDASISSGLSDFYDTFDVLEDDLDALDLPNFYKDQLFLHKATEFKCRTNRFELVELSSPTEYLVKVQCIRLAMDRILKDPKQRTFLLDIGRSQTAQLLDIAGAGSTNFCDKYDAIIDYVSDTKNLQSIAEELSARRVPAINLYDIVIDFCLLDSFDDLDTPPSAVTAVIKNSWITKSVRQGMLSSAVWGIISAKARKCQPGGFLSHFYEVMGTLTPSLAWGFLGDDPILHPICTFIRQNIINCLVEVFDHQQTNYGTLESLAKDIYKILKTSTDNLQSQLDVA